MAAPQVSIGQDFRNYRVLSIIGHGGMGIVFRAHDNRLQRDVAIKILNPGALGDEAARKYFQSEALALAQLNHNNIASVYDFDSFGGNDFIVMELVEGTSLSTRISERALPENETLAIATQVASGLEEAHEHNIVHRDLKPGNIVMNRKGVVKILDFGLAKKWRVGAQDSTISAGSVEVAGTFPYMAPEQLKGKSVDPRSDLWSAGVVLYEMATGRLPFAGENLAQLVTAILHEKPIAVRELNPEISSGLESLIGRMLDKDMSRRFQSATELRLALEQLRDKGTFAPSDHLHANSETLVLPVARTKKLSRRALFTLLLFGLLVAIAGTFTAVRRISPKVTLPAKKLVAVLPFKTIGDDVEMNAFGEGLTETLSSKLGQFTEKHALQVIPTQELRSTSSITTEKARSNFGVNLVIEGSLQKAGSTVRVNCQLVDAATKQIIHSDTITASLGDSFALEDNVVNGVLNLLAIDLDPQERQALQKYGTDHSDAYDYYLRARGYMQDYHKPENISSALASYKRAIELDPNYALAYAGIGEAYWRDYKQNHDKKSVDAAMTACQQSVALAEQSSQGHFCLGRAFDLLGKPEKAIEQFELAVVLDPNSDEAYRGLAEAYTSAGKPQNAEATYKRAISMRPQYWAGYSWLGSFYFRQARYQDAESMFRKVLELSPDNYRAYSNLGAIHVTVGRKEEAISELQQSIAIRPSADGYTNLGAAYFNLRRFSEAARTYEDGLKLDSGNFTLWTNLGDARYWTPELRAKAPEAYRKAIELAQKRLEVNPNHSSTLGLVATCKAMLGDDAGATAAIKRALAVSPNDADLLYQAALVHNHFGRTDSTLAFLGKAIALGYPATQVISAPDFDKLRNDSRFMALGKSDLKHP
jgi:serine/threonine protein kinase/tetratricopeptide (TPR) repeat protein